MFWIFERVEFRVNIEFIFRYGWVMRVLWDFFMRLNFFGAVLINFEREKVNAFNESAVFVWSFWRSFGFDWSFERLILVFSCFRLASLLWIEKLFPLEVYVQFQEYSCGCAPKLKYKHQLLPPNKFKSQQSNDNFTSWTKLSKFKIQLRNRIFDQHQIA